MERKGLPAWLFTRLVMCEMGMRNLENRTRRLNWSLISLVLQHKYLKVKKQALLTTLALIAPERRPDGSRHQRAFIERIWHHKLDDVFNPA